MKAVGRVVAITGAASGIGRELAYLASRLGYRVALLDYDREKLHASTTELAASGGNVVASAVDVRARSEMQAAMARIAQQLGPIDIIIPCAGVCHASTVEEPNVEEVEDTLKINFFGAVYMIEAVLPSMLERKQGHIVGISSLAGLRGIPFEPGYSASKAAVTVYLESLRRELRPRGIDVTTIFPGYVQTPLLEGINGAMGGDMSNGKACTPELVAKSIFRAVERRRSYAYVPYRLGLGVRASLFLPPRLYDGVMGLVFNKLPIYRSAGAVKPVTGYADVVVPS